MSNKKLATIIKAADKEVREKAEATREEIEALSAKLPELQQAVADIEDGAGATDEIKARWSQGEDVPAIEYATAQAEDEKAKYLARSYGGRVKALTNSLPASDTLLADAIADSFKLGLPGVEVITTVANKKAWGSEVPDGTIAVVLVEGKHEVNSLTGQVSGTVTAYFYRPALYRPIDVDGLEKAPRPKGVGLEVMSNKVGDENGWVTVAGSNRANGNETGANATVIDTLTIQVRGVVDGLPTIKKVETNNLTLVRSWSEAFLRDFFDGDNNPQVVPGEGKGWKVRVGPFIEVSGGAGEVVSESVEGERRTVVVQATVNLAGSGISQGRFASGVQALADNAVGTVAMGLGMLESVEAKPLGAPGKVYDGSLVEVLLTFASKAK